MLDGTALDMSDGISDGATLGDALGIVDGTVLDMSDDIALGLTLGRLNGIVGTVALLIISKTEVITIKIGMLFWIKIF